jgi:hypothetical protein
MQGFWRAELAAKPPGQANLTKVWYQHIGVAKFVLLVLLKVVDAACVTIAPLVNKQLIIYLEGSKDEPSWCGDSSVDGPPCTDWHLALLVLLLYVLTITVAAIVHC